MTTDAATAPGRTVDEPETGSEEARDRIRSVRAPSATRSTVRRHPGLVSCAALLAVFLGWVWAGTATMQLNSDKVWSQTVLALRGVYGPPDIQSSADDYLLKAPLYLFANHAFGLSVRAVEFEVLVDNLVLFASIATAYALLRRAGVVRPAPWWLVCLTALWTISVGDPAGPLHNPVAQPTVTLIHPNERNAELGLAILLLVVVALLQAGRLAGSLRALPLWAVTTGLAVAAAAVCFDDPYNLYLLLPPLSAIAAVRAAQARRWRDVVAERAPMLWYFVALTAALYAAAGTLAPRLGLHRYPDGGHFLGASSLGRAVQGALTSLSSVYNGTFYGAPVGSLTSARLLLNAALALAVVICGLTLLVRWYRPQNSARIALPLAALSIGASYVLSGSSESAAHVRYLIAFLPIFLLLLPGTLTGLPANGGRRVVARLLCGVLVVATALNVAQDVGSTTRTLAGPDVNRALYARAGTIAQVGLSKGYGTYWDADVNTYVSRGAELTIPVKCARGRLRVDYWLMDTSWLDKPAGRSYLIYQPGDRLLKGCSLRRLARQFGAPQRTVPLGAAQKLLLYRYDILGRMAPRTDPSAR